MPAPLRPELFDRRVAFGDRVRQLREQRGLTQDQLAERATLERKTVNRVETAQVAADLDSVFLIADALRVPAAALFPDDAGT